jgi:putative DNA primase/helicase
LHIGTLDLDHALRWHEGIGAVVALMTDATTNEPCGVHRTFLNADGTKRERKMLGKQGMIRLSNEEVTLGLGLVEGIEKGVAALLHPWSPIWCLTSAGGIERFPVLSGIESLTIWSDGDESGMKGARACFQRWTGAGLEARILSPRRYFDAEKF